MKTNRITKLTNRALSANTRQMSIFELLPDSEQMACEPVTALPAAPAFDAKSAAHPERSNVPICRLLYTTNGVTLGTPAIRCASDIARVILSTYSNDEIELREEIKVLYLNRANKILGVHTVAVGNGSSCAFDLQSICAGALLARASCVILCHNHPSGNLRPSVADDNITKKLKNGLALFDIRLLDHVIVTPEGSYYSYNDEGRL